MTKLEELTQAIVKKMPKESSPNKCKHGKKKGEMIRLRQEGVSIGKIGKLLNVPKGTVAWHLNNRRPITLEDILRALAHLSVAFCPDENRLEGDICRMERAEVRWSDSCRWNLGVSLSEQNNKTIDFLHSLLCVE